MKVLGQLCRACSPDVEEWQDQMDFGSEVMSGSGPQGPALPSLCPSHRGTSALRIPSRVPGICQDSTGKTL